MSFIATNQFMWRCGVESSGTDNWGKKSKTFTSVKKEEYGKAAEEVRALTIRYNTDWAPDWQRLISSGRTSWSWYFPSWWSTVGDENHNFLARPVFAIFATNSSFLRRIANLQWCTSCPRTTVFYPKRHFFAQSFPKSALLEKVPKNQTGASNEPPNPSNARKNIPPPGKSFLTCFFSALFS